MSRLQKRLLIAELLLIISPISPYAQISDKGVPNIENFSYEVYSAGAQNWDILQDDTGVMLFANNYGLLEYNGHEWNLTLQTPNKTVMRSLHRGSDGRIYLGAQNDFGFIKTNNTGQKRYHSLLPKIPDRFKNFSDVWEIYETSYGLYFLTNEAVFCYQNDTVTVINPLDNLKSFSKVNDSILVQDINHDIFVVKENSLEKRIDSHEIDNAFILKISEGEDDRLMLTTELGGILPYIDKSADYANKISNGYLAKNKIHCTQKLRGGYLAIGSVASGLLILDQVYQPVQWLSKKNGLQSNTILALGTDNIGNLWVATDVGIDYVEIASPFNKINANYNLEGTVYSMVSQGDLLYAGTNAGLYVSKWSKRENPLRPTLGFRPFERLSGQVWNVYAIHGVIYVCHQNGLFYLDHQEPKKISSYSGAWNLRQLKRGSPFYLQGTYTGIHLYELVDGILKHRWKINGFEETSRVIEIEENGTIWMAHGYKGIFKLTLNNELDTFVAQQFYSSKQGFPTSLFINLFKIDNKIVFGTEYGTYLYSPDLDSMIKDPFFNKILGDTEHIRYLKEDDEGDIWFVKGDDLHDQVGVIDFFENDKYEVIKAPMQKLHGKLNPGFENINVQNTNSVLFGTKNGFVLFDRTQNRNYSKQFNAVLTHVKLLNNDSLIYGQSAIDEQRPVKDRVGQILLPNDLNSLSFAFSSDHYEDSKEVKYSFYLEGHDQDTHNWVKSNTASYTNLPSGQYTFSLKAKNIYEVQSNEVRYTFLIAPPWYWSKTFKIIYVLVSLVLLWLLIKLFRLNIKKVQRKERLKQLRILRKNQAQFKKDKLISEKELVLLRNQRLEDEIALSKSKMEVLNTELASSIMAITQKNEVLIKVRNELSALLKKAKESNVKFIGKVIHLINQDIETEQDWKQFKIHFDKVHGNFLERMKNEFPDVTGKDLQLAAYLRLNLSSKEIASMMNITLRSVEGCRYRLRKHLDLDGSINLSEFILRY
ncbi:MAG: triple tyrosine motif-containing protein [Reichenbachiella sp.]|uniref:helix-turn-helix and ligand-binding sensor domain-containing protein n=1 Tax=Reichenbachiella sp. TaxID=2184521 RepID=UPI0032643B91